MVHMDQRRLESLVGRCFRFYNDSALSGSQSLKLFGGLAGGPMDILLLAGLEGAYEVTFNIFVPEGNSRYYNVQERPRCSRSRLGV